MKVVQVNTTANTGSTGRIAEGIGLQLLECGHQSHIAYGRSSNPSASQLQKIGGRLDTYLHLVRTRLLDQHGRASHKATLKFVASLDQIQPDIVHLHNIHGYFLNYPLLFDYLKHKKIPIVWTLHDCWAFTGHCSYFDRFSCEKWKTHCNKCPMTRFYPSSFYDDSKNNFTLKKLCFTGVERMQIVTPCKWLASHVQDSFLGHYPVQVIPYGVDLNVFAPQASKHADRIVLGVAKPWSRRKGLDDFIALRQILPTSVRIVLIGLTAQQIRDLPAGIEGYPPTESTRQLAEWYSISTVFVNPTFADNFPVANLEALACGTPIITYATGGSPEAVDENSGLVVPKNDIGALKDAIMTIINSSDSKWSENSRMRAVENFDSVKNYRKYLDIYLTLNQKNH
jgi:glycosyltransferase involved in cell wall biosynthesis